MSATKSGTVTYAGYYTVALNSSVSYSTRFSVVVKFTTPGNNYPVPVEAWVGSYSTAATASSGESYMGPDGSSWAEAIDSNDRYFNVCIKAFGTGGSGPAPTPTTAGSPLLVDYDGDGYADPGLFRSTDGSFRLMLSYLGYYRFSSVYDSQCIAQPGDFDGDGLADPAVVDTSSGRWRFYSSANSYSRYYISQTWYSSSATPVCGDYDGDRYTDPMAYVGSSGEWYILSSRYNYGTYYYRQWGGSSYTPVCGDFDGDRYADPMLYNNSNGYWYILRSRYQYSEASMWFGLSGYTPVTGDFDGDRYTDLAVYNTTSGQWYILLSSSGDQNYIGAIWDGSP